MKHATLCSAVGSAIVVTSLMAAGCGDPQELQFADWVFPVPEDTRVLEYAPTLRSERTEIAFELVDDLVIGGDPDNPDTSFYRPISVVAAANGNIFVVESGGKRVQMFDAGGTFLRSLGKEGQGPGEFQMPMAATIAGDRLVVFDMMNRRFSVWTDEGDHIADHATPATVSPIQLGGLSDGRVVALSTEIDMGSVNAAAPMTSAMPTPTMVVGSYSADGQQLARFVATQSPPMPSPLDMMNDARARTQYTIDMGATPRPSFTVGSERFVYVTPSSEYQVRAMAASGEVDWALRVAWPRPPFPESRKESRLRLLARTDPDAGVDDFRWPELADAISATMRSDGHGRLYVYPLLAAIETSDDGGAQVSGDEESAAEGQENETDARPRGRAVDVYSPDGDLIAAGLATGTWSYARGDHVYRITRDADSDESVVIRSRLVLR